MAEKEDSREKQRILQSIGAGRKQELEKMFRFIISNAPVDFNNQEIKDIHNAVYIMLERIKTRVNDRGIFAIARIHPCGSAAERTSLWKYELNTGELYTESDFLAVLKRSLELTEDPSAHDDCGECIKIDNPPVNLDLLNQLHDSDEKFNAEDLKDNVKFAELFMNEINYCLTTSCNCLIFEHNPNVDKFTIRSASEIHTLVCDACTVRMPTGTLRVNVEMDEHQMKCSLLLLWDSKAGRLTAPDCQLTTKFVGLHSLPICVDFLPALEFLTTIPSGIRDNHDYFIVPKSCNVCRDDSNIFIKNHSNKWRKSWCMSETNIFVTEMSDKHTRCYQIMKFFFFDMWPVMPDNYHIKTIVLQHHRACSDSIDDCVDCVIRMCQDLIQAYQSGQLLSYGSNHNILKRWDHVKGAPVELLLKKFCYESETDRVTKDNSDFSIMWRLFATHI